MLGEPLKNMEDVLNALLQFNPDELKWALGHLAQRVVHLESARGATISIW